MKEFIIEFTEIVTYTTIIEAESIDDAKDKFMDGEFNDIDEVYREFDSINSVTPDFEDDEEDDDSGYDGEEEDNESETEEEEEKTDDEEEEENEEWSDDYDDSMDGDIESGLTSAGWGLDESYGGYENDIDSFHDYYGEDY